MRVVSFVLAWNWRLHKETIRQGTYGSKEAVVIASGVDKHGQGSQVYHGDTPVRGNIIIQTISRGRNIIVTQK